MEIVTCPNCKNYLFELKCMAFIKGIPKDILNGDNDHSRPTSKQKNNIVFEKIK